MPPTSAASPAPGVCTTCSFRPKPSPLANTKARGSGIEIAYGFHPSPFGECLLALTGRGICGLAFVEPGAPPPSNSSAHAGPTPPWSRIRRRPPPWLTRSSPRPVQRCRPAGALPERHQLPDQGLGGPPAYPHRRGDHLCSALATCMPEPPGRWAMPLAATPRLPHPLSPGPPQNRPLWGISLRQRRKKALLGWEFAGSIWPPGIIAAIHPMGENTEF